MCWIFILRHFCVVHFFICEWWKKEFNYIFKSALKHRFYNDKKNFIKWEFMNWQSNQSKTKMAVFLSDFISLKGNETLAIWFNWILMRKYSMRISRWNFRHLSKIFINNNAATAYVVQRKKRTRYYIRWKHRKEIPQFYIWPMKFIFMHTKNAEQLFSV